MDWYSDNTIYCDCPDFGQHNFLSSNWCSAVLDAVWEWRWWYTDVLAVTLNQGLFFPMLCQQAGEQDTGRKHGQESWPNLPKEYSIP